MLDPDRDEARELLQRELAKPDYNRPESLLQKGLSWLLERLGDLIQIMPGSNGLSMLLLGVILALAVVAIFFAVRGSRRSRQLTDRTGPVLAPALSLGDLVMARKQLLTLKALAELDQAGS